MRQNRFCASFKVEIKHATYQDILKYISHEKEKGNNPKTLNQKLLVLRHYYKSIKRKPNPVEEIKIRGGIKEYVYDLLTKRELEQLYENYEAKTMVGIRNKCILGILVYQGLRAGEITHLKTSDLKIEQGELIVMGTRVINGRTLKLVANQIALLQKYLLKTRTALLNYKTKRTSEKLFISKGSGQQLSNTMRHLLKQLRKQNPKIKSLYQIRRSVITIWLQTEEVRSVQYKSGHKYLSSTQSYQQTNIQSLQEQIENLHPLNQ